MKPKNITEFPNARENSTKRIEADDTAAALGVTFVPLI